MLLESIFDDNPVVFWNIVGSITVKKVPQGDYRVPLDSCRVVENGDAVTIVSMSYMTIESQRQPGCARSGSTLN